MSWIKNAAAHVYVFVIFPLICTAGFSGAMVICEMLFQKYLY